MNERTEPVNDVPRTYRFLNQRIALATVAAVTPVHSPIRVSG